ncbi:MAG: DUF6062 family protein [Spirochaetales bacterium]|nr:DUF6062 family protein [Spirochaetales bacterium]
MKYQLETIPVHDAWAENVPCPLCTLLARAEERHVRYYLGNSVMNPETRLLVNATGFCSRHFPMMREANRAHHLGLVGHTHLQQRRKELRSSLKSLKSGSGAAARDFARKVQKKTQECLICHSMERDAERYAYTAVILLSTEDEFQQLFQKASGPCLPHAAMLAEMGAQVLGKKERKFVLSQLSDHLDQSLEQLEADVLRFTQKFDAQNDGMDWGNSRDAHARTVQALSGVPVRLDD